MVVMVVVVAADADAKECVLFAAVDRFSDDPFPEGGGAILAIISSLSLSNTLFNCLM